MKREAADIVAWAQGFGWEFVRFTAHEGALLRHKHTRRRVVISATPHNPQRAYANARAELRRKARPEAGRNP